MRAKEIIFTNPNELWFYERFSLSQRDSKLDSDSERARVRFINLPWSFSLFKFLGRNQAVNTSVTHNGIFWVFNLTLIFRRSLNLYSSLGRQDEDYCFILLVPVEDKQFRIQEVRHLSSTKGDDSNWKRLILSNSSFSCPDLSTTTSRKW